jgi:hypothetical protein
MVFSPCHPSFLPCEIALGDSAQVWLRRDDFGLSPLRGTVLRRWPGQAEVLLEEPGFGSTDGFIWMVYITHIWFIWVYMGLTRMLYI